MKFQEKLNRTVEKNNSLVCIGLDPVIDNIPQHLHHKDNPILEFNKAIIDATADLVCAYKPNSAFYEAWGEDGVRELRMTCDYLRVSYPDIPIILDAKRGDIGSTNEGYVKYAFEYLQADAVTLHPYLGSESLKVFLEKKDKGLIILCRTSNPGARGVQDVTVDGKPLWKHVAETVVSEWNKHGNCLMVIGATYPDELREVRTIAPHMTLLIPGIGAQGGDLEKTLTAGLDDKKKGLIISASRSIIFAGSGEDFAEKSREEAQKLQVAINKFRA